MGDSITPHLVTRNHRVTTFSFCCPCMTHPPGTIHPGFRNVPNAGGLSFSNLFPHITRTPTTAVATVKRQLVDLGFATVIGAGLGIGYKSLRGDFRVRPRPPTVGRSYVNPRYHSKAPYEYSGSLVRQSSQGFRTTPSEGRGFLRRSRYKKRYHWRRRR